VGPAAAPENIVAILAEQFVVAGTAVKGVVARADVGGAAVSADEEVIAGAAARDVVAAPPPALVSAGQDSHGTRQRVDNDGVGGEGGSRKWPGNRQGRCGRGHSGSRSRGGRAGRGRSDLRPPGPPASSDRIIRREA